MKTEELKTCAEKCDNEIGGEKSRPLNALIVFTSCHGVEFLSTFSNRFVVLLFGMIVRERSATKRHLGRVEEEEEEEEQQQQQLLH